MKIAIAQNRPVRGDIPANIERHIALIEMAASLGTEILIFPELSITGYEPTLAQDRAIEKEDPRFEDFQSLSDRHRMTLGIGAPTRSSNGILISLLLFEPLQPRQIYSKQYLHPDEEEHFVRGSPSKGLIGTEKDIALAICYEISIPDHAASAASNGATVYIASVAKAAQGVQMAAKRLSEIASRWSMTVLMANCLGLCDGMDCPGSSAAWSNQGELLLQLGTTEEGILVIDTETQEVMRKAIGAQSSMP